MQDVDENFGRVEQAIDTLNANASLLPLSSEITDSILTYAEGLSVGFHVALVTGLATDVPSNAYKYMPAEFLKATNNSIVVRVYNRTLSTLAINTRTATGWLGWRQLNTTAF